ncbi:MAG: hypothetical protein PHT02_00490 [Tissierellia bacterium]|nr:hypothetical protein [Tissierellia bacterium]
MKGYEIIIKHLRNGIINQRELDSLENGIKQMETLSEIGSELLRAFDETCVLIIPATYHGDRLIHEEIEIDNIGKFKACFGLDIPQEIRQQIVDEWNEEE